MREEDEICIKAQDTGFFTEEFGCRGEKCGERKGL